MNLHPDNIHPITDTLKTLPGCPPDITVQLQMGNHHKPDYYYITSSNTDELKDFLEKTGINEQLITLDVLSNALRKLIIRPGALNGYVAELINDDHSEINGMGKVTLPNSVEAYNAIVDLTRCNEKQLMHELNVVSRRLHALGTSIDSSSLCEKIIPPGCFMTSASEEISLEGLKEVIEHLQKNRLLRVEDVVARMKSTETAPQQSGKML